MNVRFSSKKKKNPMIMNETKLLKCIILFLTEVAYIYIYIYIKCECYRISPTTKFAIILNKLCTYFFGESIIQLND